MMVLMQGFIAIAGSAWPAGSFDSTESQTDPRKLTVPFFDGIKLQTTNCYPKLTNASHVIHKINELTGSGLRDWDTIVVQSLDIVLWRDISKYFKTDIALATATGSLVSSSNGFTGTPLDMGIRMRQRYTAVELWSNFYWYPLTTDCRDRYSSGRIFEPFIAAGLGYTFFRSESVFKMRKSDIFYNRIRNNWNADYWAYKMMAGFNINLGNVSPVLKQWIVTCSAFQIWNRLKGHSNAHLTEGTRILGRPVTINIQQSNKMDIDLTGQYYSIAVGRYF
jgi:hypothetical protein